MGRKERPAPSATSNAGHEDHVKRYPSAAGKQEPFAWCSKIMLRRIREKAEEPASAVSCYLALCEIASDLNDASEFTATHQHIASKASLSRRTVVSRLHGLTPLSVPQPRVFIRA